MLLKLINKELKYNQIMLN